jgi:hypothetical protein
MKAVATGGIPPYEGVVFNSATDSSRYLTNASKIYLPLDPSSSTTTYKLTYNFGAATENTDVLSFKYTRDKVYISRACGYKYLFNLTNNNTTDNILPPSINNWIKNIIIVKPNLETENEVHIKIYF